MTATGRDLRPHRVAGSSDHGGESGSALALFAAGFLVVLVLTAICVDTAIVFLGQREIVNAANAAANDAVSGLDIGTYYGTGDYAVAEALASRLAETSWRETTHGEVKNLAAELPRIIGPTTVEVTVRGDVELFFSKAFPFVPSTVGVHARAIAEAEARPPEGG